MEDRHFLNFVSGRMDDTLAMTAMMMDMTAQEERHETGTGDDFRH